MKGRYNCSGADLKKARQSCHLTQKQLAKLSGLHVNSIKRLERFDRVPATSWFALNEAVAVLRSRGLADECADKLLEKIASQPVNMTEPRYDYCIVRAPARARHGVLVGSEIEPAEPAQAKSLCGAKTRAGEPCKRKALENGRCRNHGGLSTGPKTAAGRMRIAIAGRAMGGDEGCFGLRGLKP